MIDDRLAQLVSPLLAAPQQSAVLLDIDGTLAPISVHAFATEVPGAVRDVLAELVERYALVACVSGRRAGEARRMVGLDTLTYVGNHGTELLLPGQEAAEVLPDVAAWAPRVRAFATAALAEEPDAERYGVWIEDKGPIQALHWRGTADLDGAERIVRRVSEAARGDGLALHDGRMVLELRPPLDFDKGAAITRLLADRAWQAVLYAGDDYTDLDAFAGLRALRDAGIIGRVVCVAARDDESPAAVAEAADVTVEGTDGVRRLLEDLLRL